jgi:hypothetical protein
MLLSMRMQTSPRHDAACARIIFKDVQMKASAFFRWQSIAGSLMVGAIARHRLPPAAAPREERERFDAIACPATRHT